MATYDENVLQQYADSLYRQAKWIVFWSAVDYGLKAFLFAVVLIFIGMTFRPEMLGGESSTTWQPVLLVFTVTGILAGAIAGRRKAFGLKLEAQKLLCQRQTELNTRKSVEETDRIKRERGDGFLPQNNSSDSRPPSVTTELRMSNQA